MQGKQSYINHTLNTSSFRKTCKFAKGARFQKAKNLTDFYYNIRSKATSKSCSFGIGPRPVMINQTNSPNPNRYNISQFPNDKRATTLGQSREKTIFRSMINQIQKKSFLPSPNAYHIEEEGYGKSYSLRIKLPNQAEKLIKRRVPGPGEYKQIQMNKLGRYFTSKIRNTRCISFGTPSNKQKRFQKSQLQLGPGKYDVFNSDSNFSHSKVKNMRKNTTKNFGTSDRSPVDDRSKINNPGPGMYQTFSSFGDLP